MPVNGRCESGVPCFPFGCDGPLSCRCRCHAVSGDTEGLIADLLTRRHAPGGKWQTLSDAEPEALRQIISDDAKAIMSVVVQPLLDQAAEDRDEAVLAEAADQARYYEPKIAALEAVVEAVEALPVVDAWREADGPFRAVRYRDLRTVLASTTERRGERCRKVSSFGDDYCAVHRHEDWPCPFLASTTERSDDEGQR